MLTRRSYLHTKVSIIELFYNNDSTVFEKTEPASKVEGDEGMLYLQRKEKADFVGKSEHFTGKNREQWHPLDRKSGTGRPMEPPKHGHGKGNWGDLKDEINLGQETFYEETAESAAP